MFKEKNKNWIILGLVAIIILLAVILIYKPSSKESDNLSQGANLGQLKEEIKCTCGCDYTLENCEKFDPNCSVRPGLISQIEGMANQGKSEQEILAAFAQGSAPISDISEDDDPVKGNKDAPITIIEFSDFQCPYCASFYSQTLPKIEEEYIKTGKVKLVYRDFPLPFHQNAQKAAEAAECADEQGKFWQYHDLLFERQDEWSKAGISEFKDYAEELKLNMSNFNNCLDSGEMALEVERDFQDGQSYGVTGTPAFFINGEALVGAQLIGTFRQVIDKFLE